MMPIASMSRATVMKTKKKAALRGEDMVLPLARFPATWNHVAEENSRQANMLE
jgi:hypothetical protein